MVPLRSLVFSRRKDEKMPCERRKKRHAKRLRLKTKNPPYEKIIFQREKTKKKKKKKKKTATRKDAI